MLQVDRRKMVGFPVCSQVQSRSQTAIVPAGLCMHVRLFGVSDAAPVVRLPAPSLSAARCALDRWLSRSRVAPWSAWQLAAAGRWKEVGGSARHDGTSKQPADWKWYCRCD
jgi:hypothetical protein